MDEEVIQALTREQCIEKLKELGQYGAGSICVEYTCSSPYWCLCMYT